MTGTSSVTAEEKVYDAWGITAQRGMSDVWVSRVRNDWPCQGNGWVAYLELPFVKHTHYKLLLSNGWLPRSELLIRNGRMTYPSLLSNSEEVTWSKLQLNKRGVVHSVSILCNKLVFYFGKNWVMHSVFLLHEWVTHPELLLCGWVGVTHSELLLSNEWVAQCKL